MRPRRVQRNRIGHARLYAKAKSAKRTTLVADTVPENNIRTRAFGHTGLEPRCRLSTTMKARARARQRLTEQFTNRLTDDLTNEGQTSSIYSALLPERQSAVDCQMSRALRKWSGRCRCCCRRRRRRRRRRCFLAPQTSLSLRRAYLISLVTRACKKLIDDFRVV
jgi:hypothetical protein